MRPRLLLAAALLAACSTAGLDEDARFTEQEVVAVFVRWREAQRRRDPGLAARVLHFRRDAHRRLLESELKALQAVPAGPVRTELEIHLVGHPPDLGPGEYLFLEPAGGACVATRATLVGRDGGPRIVYEPPVLTMDQRRKLSPQARRIRLAAARARFWERLAPGELPREVQRLRELLRQQVAARDYARINDLPLVPFSPDPAGLLSSLEGLGPEEVRGWMLDRLQALSEAGL